MNIGTGIQSTNLDIVRALEDILVKKARFTKVEGMRPDHSFIWCSDNMKLKGLGWKQSHSLVEGLRETYESYKVVFGSYCI